APPKGRTTPPEWIPRRATRGALSEEGRSLSRYGTHGGNPHHRGRARAGRAGGLHFVAGGADRLVRGPVPRGRPPGGSRSARGRRAGGNALAGRPVRPDRRTAAA